MQAKAVCRIQTYKIHIQKKIAYSSTIHLKKKLIIHHEGLYNQEIVYITLLLNVKVLQLHKKSKMYVTIIFVNY